MTMITVGKGILELVQGDITTEETEAIVNAANTSLLGGGGVDGAIHRAGGPQILDSCNKLGGCKTGDAKMTIGGKLKARFVIHTVGPVYRDGHHGEPELLASCYQRSLEIAREKGITTLSFPSISTGAYAYPLNEAAPIAIGTVLNYMKQHPEIRLVRFVLFGEQAFQAYHDAIMNIQT